MTSRMTPLKQLNAVGVDAAGNRIPPSVEFLKKWQELFKRVGEFEALTNPELQALADTAQAAAEAAQATADAINIVLSAHIGAGGAAHAAVTTTVNGFMLASDKVLCDGWFPNWTLSTKSVIARNIHADAALTIDCTTAGDAVNVTTADATGTVVSGGITLQPGDTVSVKPAPLLLYGGNATGTATLSRGGEVNIRGGDGHTLGGRFFLQGGNASNTGAGTSTGGTGQFTAGDGYKTGGQFLMQAGSVTGPTGNGGNLTMLPGVGAGAGADGTIRLQDAYGNDAITVTTAGLGGAAVIAEYGGAGSVQGTAGTGGGFVNGAGAAVLAGFGSTGGIGAAIVTLDDLVFYFKTRGAFAL